MSWRSFKQDLSVSVFPILGPLSGGSWMSISPIVAFKAFTGSTEPPKKNQSDYTLRSDPNNVIPARPIEIIKVPLSDTIIMEIKSYSTDDLLMTWELGELHSFIDSSLKNQEVFDQGLDEHTYLASLYEIDLISGHEPKDLRDVTSND